MNPYEVLEIDQDASQEDIKKAYKKLALKMHPVKNQGDPKAEENFKRITEAYNILNDPESKNRYDRTGSVDPNQHFGQEMPDISNIFEMFSHMGMPAGMQNMFNQKSVNSIDLNISLETVFKGESRNINYHVEELCSTCNGLGARERKDIISCLKCNGIGFIGQQLGPFMINRSMCNSCFGTGHAVKAGRHCLTCNGKKTVGASRSVKIDIPKGIPNNAVMTLEKKGNYSVPHKEYNDISVIFHYIQLDNVTIDDNANVTLKLDVTLDEILCGFIKTVKLYTDITFASDGYVNPSRPIEFKEKGLPIYKSTRCGRLSIILNVIYPEDKSKINKYNDIFLKIFKTSKVVCDQDNKSPYYLKL